MKLDYKIPLLFLLVILFLGSCSNYSTYRDIKSMYPRDDTGIGDLIKTDGYYYESSEQVYSPVVFTRDGEVKRYFVNFSSHESIQEILRDVNPNTGFYSIQNDTIKTKWAFQVYHGQYRIFEEFFLIINDTTLKRIYFTRNDEEIDDVSSDLHKFYPFDVSGLK